MVADKHGYMILLSVLTKKLLLNYRSLDYERCSAKHPSINWLWWYALLLAFVPEAKELALGKTRKGGPNFELSRGRGEADTEWGALESRWQRASLWKVESHSCYFSMAPRAAPTFSKLAILGPQGHMIRDVPRAVPSVPSAVWALRLPLVAALARMLMVWTGRERTMKMLGTVCGWQAGPCLGPGEASFKTFRNILGWEDFFGGSVCVERVKWKTLRCWW